MREHQHFGAAAVLASVVASGCAASLPDVRLAGAASDIGRLAGEWAGEYAAENGIRRSGNILFILEAGAGHAHGDVMMTTGPHRDAFGRWDDQQPDAQYLTIHFVDVDGQSVRGALDLYWDPDRECWAATVFEGRVGDGAIRGRFRTRFSSGRPDVEGWWRVKRR